MLRITYLLPVLKLSEVAGCEMISLLHKCFHPAVRRPAVVVMYCCYMCQRLCR